MKTRSHTKPPHLAPRERGSALMPGPGSGGALLGRTEAADRRPGQMPVATPRRRPGPRGPTSRPRRSSPGPQRRAPARPPSRRVARTERPPPPHSPPGPRLRRGNTKGRAGSGAPPGSRRGEAPARRKRTSRRAAEGSPPAHTYSLTSSAL